MGSFTKGPWKVVEWSRHNRDHRESIYTISSAANSKIELGTKNKENAYLIASAPELLECLESMIEEHRKLLTQLTGSDDHPHPERVNSLRDETIYKKYFDVIKKAKGIG